MSKKKSAPNFDRIISIAAMVMSTLALFFAWKGNQLANEANKIALLSISPNINVVNTGNYSTGVYLYGCQSYPADFANIDYFVQDFFYITNTGGQPSSIIFVQIPSTKYSWGVTEYDEQDNLIERPVLIQPGETAMLHLVATALAKHDLLKNIFLPYPGPEYDSLCDYNDETHVPNSLVCRAQEKRHVSRTEWQVRRSRNADRSSGQGQAAPTFSGVQAAHSS